jgi:hypothetical protein
MNRRDASYAFVGILGAAVGAGCAPTQSSAAVPSSGAGSEAVQSAMCLTPFFWPESITSLTMRFRVRSGQYVVTSSDPQVVVRVSPQGNNPEVFEVYPAANGAKEHQASITVAVSSGGHPTGPSHSFQVAFRRP